jgi:DNA-binding response OmpR family regulator
MNGTIKRGEMLDLQVFSVAPILLRTGLFETGRRIDVKARVLVIEDDSDIADLISIYLNRDGIETVHCVDGESGLTALAESKPDLVVLDINLPGMDGYEVLQTIRREGDTPVILVTARQEDEDAILGFGMGADDYVAKPFSPKVLAARIRTHLSRQRKAAGASDSDEFGFGPYLLDPRTYSLLKNGEKITMSPREIDLLLYLARSGGQPRTQENIYREVWGKEFGDLSTVAVHIQRIRKKIEDDPGNPNWIKTSHGRGYFLNSAGTE